VTRPENIACRYRRDQHRGNSREGRGRSGARDDTVGFSVETTVGEGVLTAARSCSPSGTTWARGTVALSVGEIVGKRERGAGSRGGARGGGGAGLTPFSASSASALHQNAHACRARNARGLVA
jgi:hypothetical protein